jgi:hypothetical protein
VWPAFRSPPVDNSNKTNKRTREEKELGRERKINKIVVTNNI